VELAPTGHPPIIRPGPLRPAVAGGFTIDDFTTDERAGTVTCPNGVTRRITRARKVTFGAACRACPLRPKCTTRASGRILSLHEHDTILRQARQDWASREDLRETYRQHRPMVERSIAWLIGPKSRCRQVRYRGVTKNNQWLHLRMAGLNLRRMINLGLQHTADGGWIIPGPA
jgi:Transposase DDE domain